MRNFARINNFYQRDAAIRDWIALAKFARRHGHVDLSIQIMPSPNAGVKTIDKSIRALRTELETLGYEVPANPSSQEKEKP